MEVSLIGPILFSLTVILFKLQIAISADVCPSKCICDWTVGSVNCSNQKLDHIPDFGARSASVEQLYFSHNNLTKITKESVDKFTNITILEINDNLISDIDSGAFSSLQKLKKLKLTGNLLTVVKTGTFTDLMSLQYLILSQNQIVELQENTITNLTNLISLQLAYNSLLHLNSNSIRNLPSLTHLYLRDNRLTEVPTDFLSMIPYLTFLTLNKNKISGIDQFAFAGCTRLQELHLSDNRIQSINELGFSIAGNLSTLNLVTLYLTKNRLKSIPPAIKTVETILHLELSGNLLEKVSPCSLHTLAKLRSLHITMNDNLERIESKAFAGLKDLFQVYISNNRRLKDISEDAFIDSKKVESIFLENNDLRNFSKDLFEWHNVRLLNIQTNNFVCSCDILWIQKSEMMQKQYIKNLMNHVKCNDGNTTVYIMSLKAEEMNCPIEGQTYDTTSRLITGLIAASVISCTLVLCFVLISSRNRLHTKYIQFKYRRQRDNPLFTVEDPKSKSKMFSSKSLFRNQVTREETLM
jgi:Leucine-rich repeat (LRR) protein